jgi:hypothetical protein
MKWTPSHKLILLMLWCGFLLPGIVEARATEEYWPQWRGPFGTGAALDADPPIEWSEAKHIRWKVGLPGKGHSTPIVWGDRIPRCRLARRCFQGTARLRGLMTAFR